MKKIPAFLAALLITGLVGLVMLGIGGAAFVNTNKLPVQNAAVIVAAPVATVAADATVSQVNQVQTSAGPNQAQLDAYKAQLDQAIQRINDANTQMQTLQAQLDQANQTANDASAAVQTYQNVLTQLQQKGLIRIGSDGSITIRNRLGD
jgi:septal ring factor EnvC (AmiA/AmiB activator)